MIKILVYDSWIILTAGIFNWKDLYSYRGKIIAFLGDSVFLLKHYFVQKHILVNWWFQSSSTPLIMGAACRFPGLVVGAILWHCFYNSFSKVVSRSEMHLNVTVGDLNILHSLTLFGMEGIEYFCQQWLIATSSFLSGRAKTSNSGFPFPAYIINMLGLSPALTLCLGCIPAVCS